MHVLEEDLSTLTPTQLQSLLQKLDLAAAAPPSDQQAGPSRRTGRPESDSDGVEEAQSTEWEEEGHAEDTAGQPSIRRWPIVTSFTLPDGQTEPAPRRSSPMQWSDDEAIPRPVPRKRGHVLKGTGKFFATPCTKCGTAGVRCEMGWYPGAACMRCQRQKSGCDKGKGEKGLNRGGARRRRRGAGSEDVPAEPRPTRVPENENPNPFRASAASARRIEGILDRCAERVRTSADTRATEIRTTVGAVLRTIELTHAAGMMAAEIERRQALTR
ncbi:hypothetical protein PUNSTDRAFT_130388 [Punctularia strigosozonata HHB-11173 SS5]|uniref:uncharacterized protein n=1 Tax=Punctularia strigosozonata (strain HHB-11173) TaxID=741275 RepID=UPI0004417DDF|nr:uncharacterized protein PUNSTDRAFT_130388 [Punctularia strigosozonata HHB-11173 SS5]EIN12115.1 hypothetical protein PUNSTDRAFT_130388 [Punctularia strigosozonata HHB-11173 SS5]